jgi:FdhE protein
MTLLAVGKVNYRARLDRADLLAGRHHFAREILTFYVRIARFQKELHERLTDDPGGPPLAPTLGILHSELNLPFLLAPFGKFLSLIETCAPGPLAAQAQLLRGQGVTAWASALQGFWQRGLLPSTPTDHLQNGSSVEPLREFLSRAFLQPYAEFLAGMMLPPVLSMTVCRCPRCGSLPLVGVLRPEGDGGKRFLVCSLCSQEWEFRRIFCANCGEEKEESLPVFVAEQFPHIRVECCETCKHFLRTIDLTKDGNAIPIVDDLAAIPLTLWSEQQGYQRIQANLLGT